MFMCDPAGGIPPRRHYPIMSSIDVSTLLCRSAFDAFDIASRGVDVSLGMIVAYIYYLSTICINNRSAGPMARRLTTNQEIAGSIPASINMMSP